MRTRILFAAGSLLLAVNAVTSNPALAQAAAAQAATAQMPESTSATTTLHVNVNLVVVPVTVRDTKEHLVLNLTKDDFTLEADGKPQTIRYFDRADDTPLTVGLLVDVSGSMRNQLEEERSASSAFLDGMLKPGRDQAFVVQFGHSADLLADITQSIPKLQAALQKIDGGDNDRPSFGNGSSNNGNGNSQDDSQNGSQNGSSNNGGSRHGSGGNNRGASSGGTVLYDAVYLSSDEVLKKAPVAKGAENSGQARKALILLTDGGDRGSKESLPESIEAAQRTDTTIYAIYYKGEEHNSGGGGFPGGHGGGRGGGFPGGGFPGGGHGGGYPGGGGRGGGGGNETHVDGKKILQRMADETGGRVYEVTKKMPLADIYKQIAEELRSQYRLGFSPANNEAGYHKLVVDTPKQKKVILQARDGYYTGDAK